MDFAQVFQALLMTETQSETCFSFHFAACVRRLCGVCVEGTMAVTLGFPFLQLQLSHFEIRKVQMAFCRHTHAWHFHNKP